MEELEVTLEKSDRFKDARKNLQEYKKMIELIRKYPIKNLGEIIYAKPVPLKLAPEPPLKFGRRFIYIN